MARKEPNISWTAFGIVALVALVLAANFRFPYLDKRPMHTDEAILAVKYSEFAETGHFKYDPRDYHGPGLHHITRAVSAVMRWGVGDLTDARLRTVTALCGMMLLLVGLLAVDGLGRLGTALGMLLIAVSPMQVFYSRYFIMEIPFVLGIAVFLVALWRFSQSKGTAWLLLAGVALGMQHATKETFVLSLGATLCGWIAARVVVGGFSPRPDGRLSISRDKKGVALPWLWVLVPAVIVSVTLFSSFFKDWAAVRDSVLTYGHYLGRSEGVGHEKPWHYYLTLIFWRKDGLTWSEGLIGGLGVIGMLHAFLGTHRDPARQAFLVFLSIYTLALFTVYSILGYKTPWSILGAQHTLVLLAGVGAAAIWHFAEGRIMRVVLALLFAAGAWHLSKQTSLSIHDYRADPRNPYVYSHTSGKFPDLVLMIERLSRLRPDTFSMQVINRDNGWPMPWYLRSMKNIGYQIDTPPALDAPVILVDVEKQAEVEARLGGKAYDSSGIYGLRPNVNMTMFVEKTLWDQFRVSMNALPAMHE